MLRSVVAILIVLLLGAAAGGAYWKLVMLPEREAAATGPVGGGRGGRGPTAVEAEPVRLGPVEVTAEAVGTLRSNESVVLSPEVAGRVAAIEFGEGRPVAAGQVMVGLDASVERAQFAQARAELQLATANLERARELRQSNVGTQRSLDEAQAQQLTAQAAVDLAQARLDKLTIKAPFDGVAGLRRVSLGEFVTAGAEIVNVEQIQPLKVDFKIPELFLPALTGSGNGRRIQVSLDAFPGETFPGQVYAVDPLVDEQGRAIVARARIENPADPATGDPRLRPGLFARVLLTLSEEAEAVWAPEEAIVPQGGGQFVYKVVPGEGGDGEAVRLTPVELGRRQTGEVQIVSGLAAGDRVVTAGVNKIRDNAPVAVRGPAVPAESPSATAAEALPLRAAARG